MSNITCVKITMKFSNNIYDIELVSGISLRENLKNYILNDNHIFCLERKVEGTENNTMATYDDPLYINPNEIIFINDQYISLPLNNRYKSNEGKSVVNIDKNKLYLVTLLI